jgi:hypothetical protein
MERFLRIVLRLRRSLPEASFDACMAATAMIEYGTRGTAAAKKALRALYRTDDLVTISQMREAARLIIAMRRTVPPQVRGCLH